MKKKIDLNEELDRIVDGIATKLFWGVAISVKRGMYQPLNDTFPRLHVGEVLTHVQGLRLAFSPKG